MTSSLRRRTALALAVAGTLAGTAGLADPVAQATTGKIGYSCQAPGLPSSQNLAFVLDTNAPARLYVGRSFKPTLRIKVTIPGFVIGLAQFAGITEASATGTIKLGVNGKTVVGHAVYKRTKLPPAQDLPVNLPVALPVLKPTATGKVVYKTGPVHAVLTGYKDANDKKGQTIEADCVIKGAQKTIDTVAFVKSPTSVSTTASYAKKKAVAVSKVGSTSGVRATGAVTSVLYRGSTKVRTVTAKLVGAKATSTFPGGLAKGSYKVVTSYAGSKALRGSSRSAAFTVR